MYTLETKQSFDAAHFLHGYKGKCSNIHGHRWKVVARIAANEICQDIQNRDMLMDFGDFKKILKNLTDRVDHTLIIEKGSLKETTLSALREEDFAITELPFRPTAERLAQYFFNKLKEQTVPVVEVLVYETPTNCASYREQHLSDDKLAFIEE